ncbi:hypothetical protein PGQ11_003247 [Apiospora arundinis]|uniref:WHIM1 domain-containing protein n=1 Tax=Apiospora arundinis TaxID=335852 RepID=A0ABR2J4M5_9PEZI
MAADDDSSDLSSLSSLSPVPSDDEGDDGLPQDKKGILNYFTKLPKGAKAKASEREPSPPAPKRPASPPHEYILADNPDIAFVVMFRSRFDPVLPKSLPNFGPQELERDITDSTPGDRVELFLCAVLGLLLNRKQDVKPGHYNRALEDAIATHKNQWAKSWGEKSPLAGGATFGAMNPTERLTLLRTLIIWALSSSEAVKGMINTSYKGNRHEDDLNQPLSVQSWGSDSDKRRYYLIEGLDDTAFRVYRESNPQGFNRTWWSVAGSIEELNELIDKLLTVDGGPKARKLAQQMQTAVPRFEATEEKRKRREYRQAQKERFKRPEPGFSLYEGRTRGKRMKYTYSDDEDFVSDSTGTRRSGRNTGTNTPAEPAGPVTTASGRQIKAPSRMTVDASNNITTTSPERDEETRPSSKGSSVGPTGRPRRSAAANHGTNGWTKSTRTRGYNSMDDEEEEESEPDLGDDEEEHVPDESDEEEEEEEEEDELAEDEEMGDEDNEEDLDDSPKSMVVKLKVPKKNGEGDDDGPSKLDLSKYRYDSAGKAKSPSEPEKTEDVISVAPRKTKGASATRSSKEGTPEPAAKRTSTGLQAQRPPLTPSTSSLQSTSLAYRESPDKLQQPSPLPKPATTTVE